MVDELIAFSAGSMSNSLPNLEGWEGYAVAMYLLRESWAWSCKAVTVATSWMVFCSPLELSKAKNKKSVNYKQTDLASFNKIRSILTKCNMMMA